MIYIALQVWIPCVKDLSNQGLSNTTITSSGATYNTSGKLGGCYNIPSGYITGTYEAKVNMTFACWVYFNSTVTGHVFDARNTSTGKGYQPFCITGATQIQAGNSTNGFPYFAHSMKTGVWYHLCVTHDANECRFYINGSLVGATTSGRGADMGTCNFHVGSRFSSENYSNIRVNDIRIYDNTLSPNEIEILSRGLVVHYPLSLSGENLLINTVPTSTGSWATAGSGWSNSVVDEPSSPTQNAMKCTYTGSGGTQGGTYHSTDKALITNGESYTLSAWIRASKDCIVYFYNEMMSGQKVTSVTTEWKRYSFTGVVNTSASYSANICYVASGSVTANMWIEVAGMKLEKGDKPTPWIPNTSDAGYSTMGLGSTTEYDVSGNNYHGTKVGSPIYSSDTPRYSTSTSFNGVDDCIQVPLNTFFPNAGSFTINLWFKKPELGSKGYETVFGGISGFEMDTRNSTSATLSYYVTGNNRGLTVQSPLSLNTWYMLTMVSDGTNELYYLNGEYKKQIEKKGMPTGNYFIGAWRDSVSQNFKGLISDFRVYATALSADQVKRLYNTPVSLSNNGTLLTQGEFVET